MNQKDRVKKRMYATVRRYEGVADTAAAARDVDEKFVPFISSLPGFVERQQSSS